MAAEFSETEPIRVLLADDHDILRQGLKLLLEAQPDLRVVGEARTGKGALEQVAESQPDIVVLDISMPDTDGLEACQRIRGQYPDTQVLILTMHESEEYFLQALRVGAAGYLVKKAAPAELCAAVRTIKQGGAFLYPGLAKALIRAYVSDSSTTTPASLQQDKARASSLAQELRVLTPREIEVLRLVAEGRTNQEIADQ